MYTCIYVWNIPDAALYIEVTITGLQKSFADFQGLIASLWMNRDWIDFSLGRIHFPHKIQSNMPCFNAGPNIIYNYIYIYYKYINNITVLRGRKLHIKILIQLPQTDGCGVMLLFQRYLQYTQQITAYADVGKVVLWGTICSSKRLELVWKWVPQILFWCTPTISGYC